MEGQVVPQEEKDAAGLATTVAQTEQLREQAANNVRQMEFYRQQQLMLLEEESHQRVLLQRQQQQGGFLGQLGAMWNGMTAGVGSYLFGRQ